MKNVIFDKQKIKYLAVKPKIDDRYTSGDKDTNFIVSHNLKKRECKLIDNLKEILEEIKKFKTISSTRSDSIQYIIIDEAQFFTDLYEFVKSAVEIHNKNVVVIGLDGDSDRENFGQIHKLLPLCDDIVKLKALCSQCKDGTPGIFSKKIINSLPAK